MTTQNDDRPTTRVDSWPDLQFWYGLTFTELLGMPNNVRRIYERALPRLRAEAQAAAIDAAAYPHMKPDAQKRIARRLERRTGAYDRAVETPTSPEDERRRLERAGIAVEPGGDGVSQS